MYEMFSEADTFSTVNNNPEMYNLLSEGIVDNVINKINDAIRTSKSHIKTRKPTPAYAKVLMTTLTMAIGTMIANSARKKSNLSESSIRSKYVQHKMKRDVFKGNQQISNNTVSSRIVAVIVALTMYITLMQKISHVNATKSANSAVIQVKKLQDTVRKAQSNGKLENSDEYDEILKHLETARVKLDRVAYAEDNDVKDQEDED